MARELQPILASSKSTFQWYLDNLERLAYYGLDMDDLTTLRESITSIENILNRLDVTPEKEA